MGLGSATGEKRYRLVCVRCRSPGLTTWRDEGDPGAESDLSGSDSEGSYHTCSFRLALNMLVPRSRGPILVLSTKLTRSTSSQKENQDFFIFPFSVLLVFLIFFFCVCVAVLWGLWAISSPPRDWTQALGSESMDFWPLDLDFCLWKNVAQFKLIIEGRVAGHETRMVFHFFSMLRARLSVTDIKARDPLGWTLYRIHLVEGVWQLKKP